MRTFRTIVLLLCLSAAALAPSGGAAQTQNPPATQVHATVDQVMRAILFPNANIVFFAQSEDPAAVPVADRAAVATDPLTGVYGKWEAVENSALMLAESANLLMVPGRKCTNGRDAPIQDENWIAFVQELRDAGMAAYQAAQEKDLDRMLDAAGVVTMSCSNCHRQYRRAGAARCS